MPTNNTETLQKIVDLQACVIQGRNIKTLLHRDRDYYLKKSKADVITIYVNEDEKMRVEFILEEHRDFTHLMKKYIFSKKSFSWDAFMKNCENHFKADKSCHYMESLYEIFKGMVSKKDAEKFASEIKFEDAMIMPLYDFIKKRIIGYVCFMYLHKIDIPKDELKDIRIIFETLLRPLYDNHYSIMYSKCVRVDEQFKLLTEKEKDITKKILQGKSYQEIAEQSNISINTVKTHIKKIFNKYQVNSKIELYNKLSAMV